jgi:hypothetical protein
MIPSNDQRAVSSVISHGFAMHTLAAVYELVCVAEDTQPGLQPRSSGMSVQLLAADESAFSDLAPSRRFAHPCIYLRLLPFLFSPSSSLSLPLVIWFGTADSESVPADMRTAMPMIGTGENCGRLTFNYCNHSLQEP